MLGDRGTSIRISCPRLLLSSFPLGTESLTCQELDAKTTAPTHQYTEDYHEQLFKKQLLHIKDILFSDNSKACNNNAATLSAT